MNKVVFSMVSMVCRVKQYFDYHFYFQEHNLFLLALFSCPSGCFLVRCLFSCHFKNKTFHFHWLNKRCVDSLKADMKLNVSVNICTKILSSCEFEGPPWTIFYATFVPLVRYLTACHHTKIHQGTNKRITFWRLIKNTYLHTT